jgi:hypothetical protein
MTATLILGLLTLSLTLTSAVVVVVWRLAAAINALELAIKQSTMDERERTDRKIKEAIDACKASGPHAVLT